MFKRVTTDQRLLKHLKSLTPKGWEEIPGVDAVLAQRAYLLAQDYDCANTAADWFDKMQELLQIEDDQRNLIEEHFANLAAALDEEGRLT